MPGALVVRQTVAAERNDVVGGDVGGRVLQLDEGAWGLAPFLVRLGDDGGRQHGGVVIEHAFHFDGRDVFATRDDDVLGPVPELDVAVRVDNAQVAGMEPAAGEGLAGGVGVLQVPLGDDIAPEHDLAHGLGVRRHGCHGAGVHDAQPLEDRVGHALA